MAQPEDRIIYLAAPYSANEPAPCQAREAAAHFSAGHLIEAGYTVFSPLTYRATFKQAGFAFPNGEQWYRFDRQFMNICDELVVLQLPGWERSRGVNAAIRYAERLELPVYYNKPGRHDPAAVIDHDRFAGIPTEAPRPIIYLAAPYSDPDPERVRQRVDAATKRAVRMLRQGQHIFSPISYTEIIQQLGFQPAPAHDWYRFDLAFMRRCQELHVLKLPGWRQSYGVTLETGVAEAMGIPVKYV